MSINVDYKGRIHTLILALLCQSTQAVNIAGLPLLLPLIRQDLGLSFAEAGGLASVSLLVYAAMQIPAGFLTDRYSPRKLLVIGTFGIMGLSALLALSQQYWQLVLIQFFWGFFSSFSFAPSMSIFVSWFSPERRITATSLTAVGPTLGMIGVNFLFPVIVQNWNTWRIPFLIFGIAGIIIAMLLLLWGREAPLRRPVAKLRLKVIREVFQRRQVWLCYGLQFIRFGIVQGISFWLPSLLLNEKGFPLQLTGTIIGVQAIISAPFNLFGAYLADRFKKPVLVIAVSLIMLGITSGLLVNINSMWIVILLIFVNAVFLQMYFGPLFSIAADILGHERAGISNGVSNMFAITGGLITAYLMGFLRDTTGSFELGFYSISALTAAGLVLTFILGKLRSRKLQ